MKLISLDNWRRRKAPIAVPAPPTTRRKCKCGCFQFGAWLDDDVLTVDCDACGKVLYELVIEESV